MVRNACWSVLVTPRGRAGQGLVSSTVLALGPQSSRICWADVSSGRNPWGRNGDTGLSFLGPL